VDPRRTSTKGEQAAVAAKLRERAVRARSYAERVAWYHPIDRKKAIQEALEAESKASHRSAALSADNLRSVAEDLIFPRWENEAQKHSTRNPYHADLGPIWSELAEELSATLMTLPIAGSFASGGTKVSKLDELRSLVEPHAVRSVISAESARRTAIANDPVFLAETGPYKGSDCLWVQHRASGLRARFHLPGAGRSIGGVYAKPHRLDSIDPDRPGTSLDWDRFAGLGIGRRIYEHAAALHPDVRWGSASTTPAAYRLRESLHATRPFFWAGPCSWCNQHIPFWDQARPEDFTNHP
jgi:hypothetical protein